VSHAGDVEEELAGEDTEHETDHAQGKVGRILLTRNSAGSHGRDEQRLERSAFPFPGDHHGGEERADDGHDQHNQARDQEEMTVVGLVEPHAIHNDHLAGSGHEAPKDCAPRSIRQPVPRRRLA
jgi:hypothetical protein